MTYVDLTHTFNNRMPVFPGDPLSEIEKLDKDGIVDHVIKTGMHVGTHMDAPAHMLRGGKFLNEYPPEKFFARGAIVDATGKSPADGKVISGLDIRKGDAVLIYFGWSKVFGDKEYYQNYPEISEGLAHRLSTIGISIIGTDTPSPDRAPYITHKLFFQSDILILENLVNLELLIGKSFELVALPAKFQTEAAPARVIAKIL